MRFRTFALIMTAVVALAVAAPALAQRGHGGPSGHPGDGWHGDIHHFDYGYWNGGRWWHGDYGGRFGWWWIVGPNWYWYPAPVYPYPQPFVVPGGVAGWWYWCDAYQQYYPYVSACPSGWRAVPAQ